ncbi:MAG: SDR family NAD(P)-dependent oxidoreductase [Immundisolibacterales bacterium]|nr:SDR family NAD(P)-dependent oxidoreductase [Immundisolibacterales bacterium]
MPERPAARGSSVVTGASRGIGAAVAVELEARGFEVWSLSRSGDAPAGRALTCDVTDEAALREAFSRIAKGGPIGSLVSNAGVHASVQSRKLETAEYERIMSLNATAVMTGAREIYPHLVRAGGGTIINMGSFFDRMAVPYNLAYCASKAAVGAMTRCLAAEWAEQSIRVINVAPGYVETALNREFLAREDMRRYLESRVPLKRAGRPEEVARLVAALLTEDIPYLTGETIYVDASHAISH